MAPKVWTGTTDDDADTKTPDKADKADTKTADKASK